MKRRILAALGLAATILLTACGGSSGGGSAMNAASGSTSSSYAKTESASDSSYYGGEAWEAPEPGEAANAESAEFERKLIRTAELEMETVTFEETTLSLSQLTESLGGYFANSNVWDRGNGYRRASFTVRVPVKNYQAFLDQAGALCHEVHRSTNMDDITESYYDTQGRLKTQQIKLERLQALLEQAEDMADIITIESAISETEYQIDSLSGTLRHFDNLVDYSTVTIELSEVSKFSNVKEPPIGFGSRLASAFTDGIVTFVDWLQELAVGLAYSWIWLVLLALIVFLIIKLARRADRKRKEKREKELAQGQDPSRGKSAPRYFYNQPFHKKQQGGTPQKTWEPNVPFQPTVLGPQQTDDVNQPGEPQQGGNGQQDGEPQQNGDQSGKEN